MGQCVAGINDVFDHQHVAPFDIAAQVFQNPHFATGFGAVAVGRGFDEIHLDLHLKSPHKVGDEDEGTAQKAHDDQFPGVPEFGLDLVAERIYPLGYTVAADHLVDHIWSLGHSALLNSAGQSMKKRGPVT